MKTIENQAKQTSAISLDRSLYEWVPRQELAQIVPQIVKGARAEANSRTVALSILVYCYAIGVYRSDDIAARVRRNPARSQLVHADLSGKVLAEFRRSNAGLIKECLAQALHHAFHVKWTKSRSDSAVPRNICFNSDAGAALAAEAERRLEVAEAWDLFDQEGVLGKADRA
jgi:hypothetical protein